MLKKRLLTTLIATLLTIIVVHPIEVQSGHSQQPSRRSQLFMYASQQRSPSEADKWWAAQRNVESAIAQLEAYIRESPTGEYAQTARQQLQVLKNLTVTAAKPLWVGLARDIGWRIASVEAQPNRTRVLVEVKNASEDSENAFVSFDTWPLVLIDNNGEYYPMLGSSGPPVGVKVQKYHRFSTAPEGALLWVIQGERVIAVTVDFAPLSKEAASVQIQYRDANQAQPAKFSIVKTTAQADAERAQPGGPQRPTLRRREEPPPEQSDAASTGSAGVASAQPAEEKLDPSRELSLGLSLYASGSYSESYDHLMNALLLGEKVRIPIKHRHGGPGLGLDDDLCRAELVLDKDSVELRGGVGLSESRQLAFSSHDFKVPLNKISEIKVEPHKFGRLHLRVAIKKGNKEESKNYDLYPGDASLQNTGTTSAFWSIRCDTCTGKSDVIAKLLEKLIAESQ